MTSEVTQADRDAAAEWLWDPESVSWDRRDFDKMKSGSWDDHSLIQAFARHRLTAQSGEGRSGAGGDGPTTAIIAGLWLDILEKDDRTSPEEYPDMALITEEEFSGSIRYALAALNARQSGEGERLREALRPFALIGNGLSDDYDDAEFVEPDDLAIQAGTFRAAFKAYAS